jgi:hypothetical protein
MSKKCYLLVNLLDFSLGITAVDTTKDKKEK